MAYNRDGGPLLVEPMKAAPESFLLGERLRPPKQSTMNSMLLKNRFIEGEATACQTFTINGDGERR
jgi:hypothetical protein